VSYKNGKYNLLTNIMNWRQKAGHASASAFSSGLETYAAFHSGDMGNILARAGH